MVLSETFREAERADYRKGSLREPLGTSGQNGGEPRIATLGTDRGGGTRGSIGSRWGMVGTARWQRGRYRAGPIGRRPARVRRTAGRPSVLLQRRLSRRAERGSRHE